MVLTIDIAFLTLHCHSASYPLTAIHVVTPVLQALSDGGKEQSQHVWIHRSIVMPIRQESLDLRLCAFFGHVWEGTGLSTSLEFV